MQTETKTTIYVTCDALTWKGHRVKFNVIVPKVPETLSDVLPFVSGDYQSHSARVRKIVEVTRTVSTKTVGHRVPKHLH